MHHPLFIKGGENLAESNTNIDVELKIGHLGKEQADLLPSVAINDGQIIYNENNGMQFADYKGARHSYGSVISGIFNGTEYVDFSTANIKELVNILKTSEAVHHGQLLNINKSIFMYKNVNGNSFIVKINDTESAVNANTAGYIIHLPEYKSGDQVTIDMLVSLYDDTHGEKVFFVKIVDGEIDFNSCGDLDGSFVAGDLGLSVVSNGGLTSIVSTLDSNLKVISYSVDSTGSAINNGFYIAAGDIQLVYEWADKTTLPYNATGSSVVVYNNEIHLLGGTANPTSHYRLKGNVWESASTLPYAFSNGSAVVYKNEIHILGGSTPTAHYKWNGTSWASVSTLPYSFTNGSAVVYDAEIHIISGTSHYRWNGSRWISASTAPISNTGSSVVVYNNEIHLLGNTSHYKWDGHNWASVSTLPYNIYGGKAIVHNGKIHLLGSDINSIAHYIFNGSTWDVSDDLPYAFTSGNALSFKNVLHMFSNTKHYVLTAQ